MQSLTTQFDAEDLNRINNKPYTEPVEANGRDDATVAAECLETHKKRNDSHVFDLFGGQFKSVVICPEATCKYVSKTFDPFMLVSLPLNKATATEQHFGERVSTHPPTLSSDPPLTTHPPPIHHPSNSSS